jgi:hypothetical protein
MSLRESSEWTRRSQLQHQQQQQKQQKDNITPLYRPLYSDSYIQKRKEQEHHDKFCWRIGFIVIAFMIMLFAWVMYGIF